MPGMLLNLCLRAPRRFFAGVGQTIGFCRLPCHGPKPPKKNDGLAPVVFAAKAALCYHTADAMMQGDGSHPRLRTHQSCVDPAVFAARSGKTAGRRDLFIWWMNR